MENNLRMSLIRKWFEMTKARIKKEDYRNINPYWCNRFILVNGVSKPKDWWEKFIRWYNIKGIVEMLSEEKFCHKFEFKNIKYNIMTLGYPKKGDTERILKLQHKGIEIRTGNHEWGAEPGKLYFVIKHGEIINN